MTDGKPNLWTAARAGDVEAVRRLIATDAPINGGDAFGMTPLHWAAYAGKREIAVMLIAAGADVRARDASGEMPLHYAANKATTEFAALTSGPWRRSGCPRRGRADAAIWNGRVATSALLIARGADVEVADGDGMTPLDRAGKRLFDDLAELLRRHGGGR